MVSALFLGKRDRERRRAFITRDDPEYRGLISDVGIVKGEVKVLGETSARVELRLLGEWDDDKKEWRPGVLQELQAIRLLFSRVVKVALWTGGIATTLLTITLGTLITLSLQNHAHLQTIVPK